MAAQKFSRTWWGQRFISALETIMDSGRLGRGRSYARGGKVKEFKINKGQIDAKVRGSINPYFGVTKEPLYKTTVKLKPIAANDWQKVIQKIATKAGFVSKLLMNEMPDNIEDAFAAASAHLLPHSRHDFETDCSCPDYANPCKHIAGVYFLVAAELDRNPLLLFELRGLTLPELQHELAKTPLGQALLASFGGAQSAIEPRETYFTRPERMPLPEINFKSFWLGTRRLPLQPEPVSEAIIPAIMIKKLGDNPPFWQRDNSFIETMEEMYKLIRKTKSQDLW